MADTSLARSRNRRPAWWVVVGLVACGFVATACSDSPDPASGPVAVTVAAPPSTPATTATPVTSAAFRIGLVAPGAEDDRAWTQSMIDSLERLGTERDIDVDVAAGLVDADDAEEALRGFADGGHDLVIAHGVQFGRVVQDVADEYPDVAFASGTSSMAGANVFAYSAAAEQGGYVNGVIAAALTSSNLIGVVGPVPAGDARAYISGFRRGVTAEAAAAVVDVIYIDSFSDVRLASEAAQALVADGVDVLTGSGQMVTGAIGVAVDSGAPWFGTQSDQRELGPDVVVASQVYHWEVVLAPMVDRIATGSTGGEAFVATFANGGLGIEFNDGFGLDPAVRARADAVIDAIADGSLVVEPPT
ncbi:MAG: BMP family protein [Ilumatobacter sp.]|nr:BMP family protein [Ilumatobacter sp.]